MWILNCIYPLLPHLKTAKKKATTLAKTEFFDLFCLSFIINAWSIPIK